MTFCGSSAELRNLGIRPSRSKGQHFLTDNKLADWIVERADIKKEERVLEIGPGLGILTERLARKTEKLTVIELEEALASHIEKKLGVHVILGDAVAVDFPGFDKVVSNLPYQISSPITFKILDTDFEKGILMYQKEFAEHLVAQPGERAYSRISVMAGWKADCRIIKQVSKGCFNPVPKVDSAVVELVPKEPGFQVLDDDTFRLIVRALFSHKNRKVRNGIMAEHRALGLEKERGKELAEEAPYFDLRPVTLSPAELAEISNYFYQNSK